MRRLMILSALLVAFSFSWPAGAAAGEGKVPSAVDGVLIHYRVDGAGKTAVVLVHCWSCDAGYWKNQIPELASRYKVVAVDLAGHGDSGLDRKAWTIKAFALDVKTVVEKLKLKKVILIGHSMGGPVILEAAKMMPERVIGLIPVDTLRDVGQDIPEEGKAQMLTAMKQDFPGFTRMFVSSLFGAGADPNLVKGLSEDMASAPAEVGLGAMQDLMKYDQKAGLAGIKAPIHAINGEKWPTNVEGNQKFAPQFRASIIPGTGHFPHLEKPEEFNRVLEEVIKEFLPAKKK